MQTKSCSNCGCENLLKSKECANCGADISGKTELYLIGLAIVGWLIYQAYSWVTGFFS